MSYVRTVFQNGQTVDAAQVLNKFDSAIYSLYNTPLVKTVNFNAAQQSLNANSTSSTLTINAAQSGYTPLGIVGWSFDNGTGGSNSDLLHFRRLRINGSNIEYMVRNVGSSTAKFTITFIVLYLKTDIQPAAASLSLDE